MFACWSVECGVWSVVACAAGARRAAAADDGRHPRGGPRRAFAVAQEHLRQHRGTHQPAGNYLSTFTVYI